MQIGLDFGTTNSSVAVYDGSTITMLPLDPRNTANPRLLRSSLFLTREGVAYIGREAIDRFLEGNVGREIDYAWKYIGDAELTFADMDTSVIQALYAYVDNNAPGRLFQSLKSGLRDAGFTHTSVFGRAYTLEELIALALRLILLRVQDQLGQPVTGVVVGRPVHYATDPAADALAFKRMRYACKLAALPNVTFLEEPSAAALDYARQSRHAQRVLVFDFGGGTLDLTVMQIDRHGQTHVLATDGVPVGGDVLDQRIVMGRMLKHFGEGATLGARKLPFPVHVLEHLSEWQSIVDLTQPRYLEIIDEGISTSDRPEQLRALRTLVRRNYGLLLYEAVEQAKVALSDRNEAVISLHREDIAIDEPLPRWDFERLIGPDVRDVEHCIDRALAAAGLTPAAIDTVLRTGGSSRVPRFVRLLSQKFGAEKLHEMDVFTGVAAGLAIAAWQRGQ
jgi:hypothetical chaperone protein